VQIQPDPTTRLGGWLFRHRSALPLPVAVAILVIPAGHAASSVALAFLGVLITALGELIPVMGRASHRL